LNYIDILLCRSRFELPSKVVSRGEKAPSELSELPDTAKDDSIAKNKTTGINKRSH